MFDPNENPLLCEKYISQTLGSPLRFVKATRLTQSSRIAPWKVDVNSGGMDKAFVMQFDADGMEYEYKVLKALQSTSLPTPKVYGLDLEGKALGVPCFFSDFMIGGPILTPMLAGEDWAENEYTSAVVSLLEITEKDLGGLALELDHITPEDILEKSYTSVKQKGMPLANEAYSRLIKEKPVLPPVRFSNGDLWMENFLVHDHRISGIIDFRNSSFSDPVYEFLLSFFASPELRGRGMEERFCRLMGLDPAILHWYHGLEYFETWAWMLRTGETFAHYTLESVEMGLKTWLEGESTA